MLIGKLIDLGIITDAKIGVCAMGKFSRNEIEASESKANG
jgi:hypothetical protein